MCLLLWRAEPRVVSTPLQAVCHTADGEEFRMDSAIEAATVRHQRRPMATGVAMAAPQRRGRA
jgi:hypothetical protein